MNTFRRLFSGLRAEVSTWPREVQAVYERLPAAELPAIRAAMESAIPALGSLTAHRLLRWEVREGHARVLAGEPDARRIMVPGGWSAMAEAVGVRNHNGIDAVRRAVLAQALLRWNWNGRSGNLLSYSETTARPGRRAEVALVLGDALLPDHVFEWGGTARTLREARRLVPVLDLPPLVGRERDHAAQAALQLAVLAELRMHARELAETGAVTIGPDRWAAMAADVGLPAVLLLRVLDAWTRDGDDAPAFLHRLDGDRWTLAASHGGPLAFIAEGGRAELDGAERSKRRRKDKHRSKDRK